LAILGEDVLAKSNCLWNLVLDTKEDEVFAVELIEDFYLVKSTKLGCKSIFHEFDFLVWVQSLGIKLFTVDRLIVLMCCIGVTEVKLEFSFFNILILSLMISFLLLNFEVDIIWDDG
jgi:hypothetical protein